MPKALGRNRSINLGAKRLRRACESRRPRLGQTSEAKSF